MFTKGFILVSGTGQYEDYREELIAFSESKKELEDKIVELRNDNSYLKKYEEVKGIIFYYFRNYNWARDENDQFNFNNWIKNNPIPEEILEFIEVDEHGIHEDYVEVPSLLIKELSTDYKWVA